MVTGSGWVRVVGKDIDNIISWVPVRADRVPHPDEVVQAVVVGHTVVHDTVELFGRSRFFVTAPPELDTVIRILNI
jgi:hypothetical protein